jgi:hypothetical protein
LSRSYRQKEDEYACAGTSNQKGLARTSSWQLDLVRLVVVLGMPLHGTVSALPRQSGFLRRHLGSAEKHLPQSVGNQESLGIILSLFVYDVIDAGALGRMNVQSRFLGVTGQLSQFLRKRLLFLQREVLVAEKDDATGGDGDGEFADKFIRIGGIEEIAETEIGVLAADTGRDFEEIVLVKTAGRLEGFNSQFGNHIERRAEVEWQQKEG